MKAWADVIGHEWAIELLAKTLTNERIGHAYLFTGAAQVGKTMMVMRFAMALNCTANDEPATVSMFGEVDEGDKRPCGTCRSCRLIMEQKHPDVTILEPDVNARGKKTLKIEAVRQLQRQLQLAVYEGPYKIAIITDFDSATIGAANAFLKTLEEPPAHVILLLTATAADTLLDTIKSRCRVLNLRPLPPETIRKHLIDKLGVPSERATLLAHVSNGRPGWAITAAADPTILESYQETRTLLEDVLANGIVLRFKVAEKLAKQPEVLFGILDVWGAWWRDVLLVAEGAADSTLTNVDVIDSLRRLSEFWDGDVIRGSLQETNAAARDIARNANTRLVLENLLLRYPQRSAQ